MKAQTVKLVVLSQPFQALGLISSPSLKSVCQVLKLFSLHASSLETPPYL